MTDKQRRFAEEYTRDFNALQAAVRAGYSEKTAGAIGHENLNKPEIKAAIAERMDALSMSADEALARLSEQARGAYAHYIRPDGTVDLDTLINDGKAHLIKGTKFNSRGDLEVQFHDAQSALRDIAKIRALFIERHDHTTGGEPITQLRIIAPSGDEG